MGVRKSTTPSRHIGRKGRSPAKVPIELYEHKGKSRPNNPPVGLVDSKTDPDGGRAKYQFDPHLDPNLNWAGKQERLSFEVPVVSLHVHERIDTRTIIETVRKTNTVDYEQLSLFNKFDRNRPISEDIQFYRHSKNWSNRLVAGDSLLVMTSLLEKEGMGEKVQMVYFDPPYGIKYGSNFQPFVNKREVKDKKDGDLNQEPEMIRAFRDTWELGIHSYLSYLRDRVLLAKDLLTPTGSIFIQISIDNLHLVRAILDEIFGAENFVSMISYSTSGGFDSSTLSRSGDYILWYAKDKTKVKYRALYQEKHSATDGGDSKYDKVELKDGTRRALTPEEKSGKKKIPEGSRVYRVDNIISQGASENTIRIFKMNGKEYDCGPNHHWKTSVPSGMNQLAKLNRITISSKGKLGYVRYWDDFPFTAYTNIWNDIGGAVQSRKDAKVYCVQTGSSIVERCMLMATDPGDLVIDPTCGSGTTAVVAEEWGRRWITCDTSRVAVALAKQRLLTMDYPFYTLQRPDEGVDSGFVYRTANRVTLGSLANNERAEEIKLYDQPVEDRKKVRVTGPFTVEAVPSPTIRPLHESSTETEIPDQSIVRSGETGRQREWRDELYRTGVRAKNKQMLEFARLELSPVTRFIHAEGELKDGTRVAVAFGPEHAPLEARLVSLAIEEAQSLVPKPKIVIFAAFQFDPEAAKDIDDLNWPGVQVLKAQMNPDLFTSDLKKKRGNNESFWLIGQPDIDVREIKTGEYKGLFKVEVSGFDYFNPVTGAIESGGKGNIAMWMLDTDYDGRSLFPQQVFFPIGGSGDGWTRLAKILKTEIDEELVESYQGTVSIPFAAGKYKRIAVKIIDDRGIESLRILALDNDN